MWALAHETHLVKMVLQHTETLICTGSITEEAMVDNAPKGSPGLSNSHKLHTFPVENGTEEWYASVPYSSEASFPDGA